MAQWQNQANIDNWNMQNEYNLPVNQMARYKDAGLNPNLIYGQGSSATAGSVASPSTHPVQSDMSYQNWAGAFKLDKILANALQAAQLSKTEQETSNLREYQRVIKEEAENKNLLNVMQRYTNAKTKEEADMWRDILDWQLMNSKANAFLTDSKRFGEDARRHYLTDVQTPYTKAQTNESISRTTLNLGEYALLQYRKDMMSAQTADALASAGLKNAQAEKVAPEIVNLLWDAKLKGDSHVSKELQNQIDRILITNGVNLKAGGPAGLFDKLCWSLNSIFGLIPPM